MTDPRMQPPRNAFGTAALVLAVLGILGLIVGSVIPALFWAAGALTVIAVVLGALGARRAKRAGTDNRATAVTGAVLGALATAWFLNGALVTTNAFHQVSCAAPQQSPASPGANTGTSAATADGGGGPLGYDTTRCFEDGVQVTASAPEPYALGKDRQRRQDADVQGKRIVSVQITIRNGSTSVLDLDEFYSIGAKDADGRRAQALFEGDDHSSGLGRTLLLPGMKKAVTQRFALPPNAATRLDTEVEFARAADRRTWLTAQDDESVGWSGPVR
ncbi:DUF4190 domain-containing protein [Streptomyces sp. NPDC048595]|uniref:DUF4190 domain-containing protein n=1 Tax=Streptomyces sp. NPDC048595 TaxID=3365576 RepID=UPI00371491CF